VLFGVVEERAESCCLGLLSSIRGKEAAKGSHIREIHTH
jgi:hypothetical protein